jgi:hypothetical protein
MLAPAKAMGAAPSTSTQTKSAEAAIARGVAARVASEKRPEEAEEMDASVDGRQVAASTPQVSAQAIVETIGDERLSHSSLGRGISSETAENLFAAADADASGKIDKSEFKLLYQHIQAKLTRDRRKLLKVSRRFKLVCVGFVVLLVLMAVSLMGNFALMFAVIEMSRQTEIRKEASAGSTMTTLNGNVVATGEALVTLPLIVLPVLPSAQLSQLRTLELSFAVPGRGNRASVGVSNRSVVRSGASGHRRGALLPGYYHQVLQVSSVAMHSRTAIDVFLAHLDGFKVEVQAASATLVAPTNERYTLCAVDATCAALTVRSEDKEGHLIEAARALLLEHISVPPSLRNLLPAGVFRTLVINSSDPQATERSIDLDLAMRNSAAARASRQNETRRRLTAEGGHLIAAPIGVRGAAPDRPNWPVQGDAVSALVDADPASASAARRRLASDYVQANAPGVGGWGGKCTCPNGNEYEAGDNYDYCVSLACIGGSAGQCNRHNGAWTGRKVTCAPEPVTKQTAERYSYYADGELSSYVISWLGTGTWNDDGTCPDCVWETPDCKVEPGFFLAPTCDCASRGGRKIETLEECQAAALALGLTIPPRENGDPHAADTGPSCFTKGVSAQARFVLNGIGSCVGGKNMVCRGTQDGSLAESSYGTSGDKARMRPLSRFATDPDYPVEYADLDAPADAAAQSDGAFPIEAFSSPSSLLSEIKQQYGHDGVCLSSAKYLHDKCGGGEVIAGNAVPEAPANQCPPEGDPGCKSYHETSSAADIESVCNADPNCAYYDGAKTCYIGNLRTCHLEHGNCSCSNFPPEIWDPHTQRWMKVTCDEMSTFEGTCDRVEDFLGCNLPSCKPIKADILGRLQYIDPDTDWWTAKQFNTPTTCAQFENFDLTGSSGTLTPAEIKVFATILESMQYTCSDHYCNSYAGSNDYAVGGAFHTLGAMEYHISQQATCSCEQEGWLPIDTLEGCKAAAAYFNYEAPTYAAGSLGEVTDTLPSTFVREGYGKNKQGEPAPWNWDVKGWGGFPDASGMNYGSMPWVGCVVLENPKRLRFKKWGRVTAWCNQGFVQICQTPQTPAARRRLDAEVAPLAASRVIRRAGTGAQSLLQPSSKPSRAQIAFEARANNPRRLDERPKGAGLSRLRRLLHGRRLDHGDGNVDGYCEGSIVNYCQKPKPPHGPPGDDGACKNANNHAQPNKYCNDLGLSWDQRDPGPLWVDGILEDYRSCKNFDVQAQCRRACGICHG